MSGVTYLSRLREICGAATQGPWWANGLDIESSHVVVAEGKPHQRRADDDLIILTTGSILGDRDVEEAQATADYVARFDPPTIDKLLAVVEAAEDCKSTACFDTTCDHPICLALTALRLHVGGESD